MGAMGAVMITGGAGFLGRHLAASIAGRGEPVTVLDDLSGANSSFDCPELAQNSRITCLKGTLRDEALVRRLVAAHPVVVHLASVVGVEETVSHTLATVQNLGSTLNLVGALTREHAVVFASSADVYGAHSHLYQRPMREDDCFLYEHGLVNRWVYPHVKALEENLIANSPARSAILRVFNSYGPGMDFPSPKRVIPHFIASVLARRALRLSGDGRQLRTFCHVEDMVRGFELALAWTCQQPAGRAGCFNLGGEQPIAIRDLAGRVIALALELGLLREPLAIQANAFHYSQAFDDSWSRIPDVTRARERLGFQPVIGLEEGLRRTLAHYAGRGESVIQW
jgi:nucleoside-diphosphate-sugar epimerase